MPKRRGSNVRQRRRSFTRRDFLKTGAAAGAAALAVGLHGSSAYGASDSIRVGLIGCGSRGTAAARDCMRAAKGVEVVAVADMFADRAHAAGEQLGVASKHRFSGTEAPDALLASDDINLVILAAPPAFRPAQFAAAVSAGKHVFMEPPVAICPAGYAMVNEASDVAIENNLTVGVGLQRRHDPATIETMKRVRDGAIGRIVTAQCYWNQGGMYTQARKIGQSDVEWQLRNWRYFTWLSGDIVVERHVHNIDVINWAIGAGPETVHGLGGRQYRTGGEHGNVYDHFGTEFFYPGDIHVMSMCRQIEGADTRIAERVVGSKGSTDCRGRIDGENAWTYKGPALNPYVAEHAALIDSIRTSKATNEVVAGAQSTLAAIMARESAYTRMNFKSSWFLSKCKLSLLPPASLDLEGSRHVEAVAEPGRYEMPGAPQRRQR